MTKSQPSAEAGKLQSQKLPVPVKPIVINYSPSPVTASPVLVKQPRKGLSGILFHDDVTKNPENYTKLPQTYLVLAMTVAICFNCPFGCTAAMFSMSSVTAFRKGDTAGAKKRARISLILSVLGIISTMVVVVVLLVVSSPSSRSWPTADNLCYVLCYMYVCEKKSHFVLSGIDNDCLILWFDIQSYVTAIVKCLIAPALAGNQSIHNFTDTTRSYHGAKTLQNAIKNFYWHIGIIDKGHVIGHCWENAKRPNLFILTIQLIKNKLTGLYELNL